MSLAHGVLGAGERLVMVHGFAQNRACWGPLADRLAARYEVVLVDAPGHGESRHDEADPVEAARLVLETGGRAHYLGYSMGGRIVLHAAIASPELLRSMVLIGVTPGIEDPVERVHRRRADAALADAIEADGLPAFLDRWLAMSMFAGLTDEQQNRPARLTNRPEGLAASLRFCGTGSQRPLWDRLAGITVPTKLIVGEIDEKFRAVSAQVADRLPTATLDVVPGVGHAAHLEAPSTVADLVESFSRTTGPS